MRSSAEGAYDPLADTSQLIRAIVFGPNVSRRLGHVLGINLLPPGEAFCTYRCLYCPLSSLIELVPSPERLPRWRSVMDITSALTGALELLKPFKDVEALVLIGNGEPTLHPELKDVISEIREIRDAYVPRAKLAIFTNSSLLANEGIAEALSETDYVVAKLDSAEEGLWRRINRPHPELPGLKTILAGLRKLRELLSDGKLVVSISALELQNGISNIDDVHLKKIAHALMEIQPDEVHIEAPPPVPTLRLPPRKAMIRAAARLSDSVGKIFLLIGTSSPIPVELLRQIGLGKALRDRVTRAVVPEPIRAFLLEGPGARTRLRLLEILSDRKMSCNRLARELGMSWWSVKRHIERLVELGLVKAIPFGKRVLYTITPLGASALLALKSGTEEISTPLRLL